MSLLGVGFAEVSGSASDSDPLARVAEDAFARKARVRRKTASRIVIRTVWKRPLPLNLGNKP